MVVFPAIGRIEAAAASIASNCPSNPRSPGFSIYASEPGGPSKISTSNFDKASLKLSSEGFIQRPLSKRAYTPPAVRPQARKGVKARNGEARNGVTTHH